MTSTSAVLPPFKESTQRQSLDFLLILSLSLFESASQAPLRDQPLNPIINPCTDPSPGRIWPLPDSTFLPLQSAFVPMLTPSISLPPKIPVPPWRRCCPTPQPPRSRLGSPPGGGQTDQNQCQVDQLTPTENWWNVFGKPPSTQSGFQQMGAHVTDAAAVAEWHYLSSQQPPALSRGKINWHVHSITLHSRNTL